MKSWGSKPADFNRSIYYKNKLEFSLETGWLSINIPWPFDFLVGDQVANFAKGKENTDNPDQLKKLTGEALEEEVERLTSLYNRLAATEVARTISNVAAARIPPQEVSDRLLRFEAHLSREFDRTMSQLERRQRTRLGQPVLPELKVRHSLS